MVSRFWEGMGVFHSRNWSHYSKNGKKGLAAFRHLRSKLETHWKEEKSNEHPIIQWVGRGSEPDYGRLFCLASKIRFLEGVPSVDSRLKKLADPIQFESTLAELEIAFRLKLAGLSVSFIDERPGLCVTPDILVNMEGRSIWVEVTATDPDARYELECLLFERMVELQFHLSVSWKLLLVWTIAGSPNDKKELEKIVDSVKEAGRRAVDDGKLKRVSYPGKIVAYIAPPGQRTKIPSDMKMGSYSRDHPPRQHIEFLVRKVRRKVTKDYPSDQAGLLIVYDPIIGPGDVARIISVNPDDLRLMMRTYPVLAGMALVIATNIHSDALPSMECTESREFKHYLLHDGRSESIILWKGDVHEFPESIETALLSYSENLHKFMEAQSWHEEIES